MLTLEEIQDVYENAEDISRREIYEALKSALTFINIMKTLHEQKTGEVWDFEIKDLNDASP